MAGLLSAAEIASMRATQATAWPDSVIVIRASGTVDGMGGYTQGTAAIGTVAGRIMPMNSISASELLGAAQPVSAERYWLTVAYDADVNVQDTVKVGGQLLYVTEVNLDVGWETAKRCKLTTQNQGVM